MISFLQWSFLTNIVFEVCLTCGCGDIVVVLETIWPRWRNALRIKYYDTFSHKNIARLTKLIYISNVLIVSCFLKLQKLSVLSSVQTDRTGMTYVVRNQLLCRKNLNLSLLDSQVMDIGEGYNFRTGIVCQTQNLINLQQMETNPTLITGLKTPKPQNNIWVSKE